jgi:hypothetical protein
LGRRATDETKEESCARKIVERCVRMLLWTAFRWNFVRSLYHFLQKLFEIVQAGGRNDDVVASSADIFGDAQKSSTRIFLERKDEGFALDLHLSGFERIFVDRWFGLTVGPPAKR